MEEVIREESTQEEVRWNTASKMVLDIETLKMIEGIKEAHDAVARRTARLLARVLVVPNSANSTTIPRNRRLKAPEPVAYPWIKAKKRGRR